MPCERKHIEAIERCFEHYAMLGNKESFKAVIAAISAALSACDESQCAWRDHAFGSRVAGCSNLAYIGTQKDSWVFCPHCGRKIAPLPAAPEGVKP